MNAWLLLVANALGRLGDHESQRMDMGMGMDMDMDMGMDSAADSAFDSAHCFFLFLSGWVKVRIRGYRKT